MKRGVSITALGIVALALVAFAWSARPNLDHSAAPQQKPAAAAERAHTSTESQASAPMRDLFEFSDQPQPGPSSMAAPRPTEETQPAPSATPAPRARLIGFVRTPTSLKAALALGGRIEIVALHEERTGFRVLELDAENARVRVRAPEGDEIELALATP